MRDDGVEAGVGERQRLRPALDEDTPGVALPLKHTRAHELADREIEADCVTAPSGELPDEIAIAAAHIEDARTGGDRRREAFVAAAAGEPARGHAGIGVVPRTDLALALAHAASIAR